MRRILRYSFLRWLKVHTHLEVAIYLVILGGGIAFGVFVSLMKVGSIIYAELVK